MGTRTNLIRVAQVPVMAAVGAGAGDDARTTVRDDAFVLEVEGATRRAVQNPFSPAAGAGLVGTPREHPRGCPGPSTGGARRASRGTSVATLIAAVALLCVKMLAVDQQPRAAVRGGLFQALMQREVLPHHAARQELIFGSLRNSLLATGPTNSTVHTAPASRSDEGNTAREKALHARELEEQADEEKALAKEEAARQEAHAVVEKWEGKQQADEEKALAKEESARKMAHEVVEKWEGKSAAATGQRAVPPRSPLIVNASHKHDATPRLPLLPTSRDELLTEARSVERTLARDGRYVLRSAELEGRMVAEQLLVSQFQPRWLRGRGGGDAANVTGLHAANGTGSGRVAKSVLRRPQPAPADVMDPDVKEFMHEFRHGVENSNSSGLCAAAWACRACLPSACKQQHGDGACACDERRACLVVSCAAYQDIVIADRMVTEPDDIVKIEDEVRRQAKERRKRAELVHEQSKNRTHELPGAFRWFQDDDEKLIDNATNLTYGTWVWCKNDT